MAQKTKGATAEPLSDEITRAAPASETTVNAGPTGADGNDSMLGLVIEGKYRLVAKLGAGGMGSVYQAERLLIGDQIAVKILHPEHVAQPQSFERFRREAQAAARLKHPNAVSIYDFGETSDGLVFLVMELVEGQTLRQIIKNHGPLTTTAAAEIISQVCSALEEAHERQIVHRDLKPDNIIVNRTNHGVRAKVLDFGIAKLRDMTARDLTQTGSVMGTPHYMSPEQCLGEELDHRSDIYSLGIVLFEMLTGTVPFNSPISTAVVVQHVNKKPPSPRAINVSISVDVERVVLQALEKAPDARQQTASALSAELANALTRPHLDLSAPSGAHASIPRLGETQVMTTPASVGVSSRNISKTTWLAIVVVLMVVGAAIALIAQQNEDAGVGSSQNAENIASSSVATPGLEQPQQSPLSNAIRVDEVRQFLESWRTAWERKDLHIYSSFYDESFIGRNYSSGSGYTSMTRSQWLKDKEQKFRRSSLLAITIGEPEIRFHDDGASVMFSQEFRSSGYADRGAKTLHLRKTPNGLKIFSEDFVPRRGAK